MHLHGVDVDDVHCGDVCVLSDAAAPDLLGVDGIATVPRLDVEAFLAQHNGSFEDVDDTVDEVDPDHVLGNKALVDEAPAAVDEVVPEETLEGVCPAGQGAHEAEIV